MEIAGALLSASVQPLIERLISHELDIFARHENIHADIKDWEKMLAEIKPLLDDAEDKLDDPAVKNWVDDFRDLTYDIEDVLDEFNTEALQRKVMEDSQAITNKLRKLIPTSFTSFAFKNKMASRITEITKRLERINGRQEKNLNLRSINANGPRPNQPKKSRLTTSLVVESDIYGRIDDKKAILQMLLRNDEGGNNSISVIAILGMGGIGKTTLAQLVYNDSAVEDYFDIKAWVCVSDNFDVTILTRTILHKVDPEIGDLKDRDLDSLQVTLKGRLSQKKFLLILDDVWEEDYSQWDRLRRPFISASSSKIVVTTRKNNAAPIAAGAYAYRVKELPDDECLSVLARHALAAQSFDAHLDLKETGQELVKRCDGLPLAAKVLGGLLRNKRSRGEWECVLRNKLWNSPATSSSVHPTLKLSYNDLPSHLKRCFVYCAIVPKDYEFDRDELIFLWMAEGFLDHPQGGTLMEDLGIEYFEELVSRSFFQSSNSKLAVPVFVMHDLISDLAQTIAKDMCYNYENKLEGDMSSSKYEKVRHASFSLSKYLPQKHEVYNRMKNLRTIVGFPIFKKYDMVDIDDMLEENCYQPSPQSRCLRVISITAWSLPKSIVDLKHLRHLNLSFSPIEQLPESVSSLLNLHTLLLHCCEHLKKLPDKTRNLVNLRHLDIAGTDDLLKLPSGIGVLTNLQTLSKFIVDKGDGTTIAELENLNNLRGSLSIEGLQNVQDAKLAILKEKKRLEELVLIWTAHGRNDMSVLESLEPHQNLKRLTIEYYGGAEFPSWVSNIHLYSELVSLNMKDCGEAKLLPPLGQLRSLEELRIDGLKAVETIGVEFYGNVVVPFPSLERLEIRDMSVWREWSHGNMGGEGFPNLQTLWLDNCPKLIGSLPSGLHRLRRLSKLQIIRCGNLVSFPPISFSLMKLRIQDCGNLLSLPDGLMVPDDNENQPQSRLEYLEIKGCQGLSSLPPGKFPAALKILKIEECSLKLESAISEKNAALEEIHIEYNDSIKALPSIDCLQSLRTLFISSCPALESFPEAGFLSTSLEELDIYDCKNLSLLPIRIQSHFPSLRHLSIKNCPKVVSLIEAGGVQGSLTSLEMDNCVNLRQPIAEWGLGMLSSLKRLQVRGRCPATTADVVSFPDNNCCWLPTSLKVLVMAKFLNLESISMGLLKLTSLQTLDIRDCPKLRSLPREALPLSLERLFIFRCPLLKQHYSSKKQKGSLTVEYSD